MWMWSSTSSLQRALSRDARNIICRTIIGLANKTPDSLIIPQKSSTSVEADIVNHAASGIYFLTYNKNGFLLSNGIQIIGPCAAFPQNAFCWNVSSIDDVNEESLSLFFALEPKLEMLLIGKGATNVRVDQLALGKLLDKYKTPYEVLPTQAAIGTFNFLKSEGRYVAGAFIPPARIDVYDEVDQEASCTLLAEELVKRTGRLPEDFEQARPLDHPQSPYCPLLGPPKEPDHQK